jgi:hypothetical protein
MADFPDQTPPPKSRLILGGFVFLLSQITVLLIPLVTTSTLSITWKTLITGLLIFGIPEVMIIIVIAILGKQGFRYLRSKVAGTLKRYLFPETVTPLRYYIGLVLFILPLFFGWIIPYFPNLIPNYEDHRFILSFMGDVMLVISFLVLGGNFWDKIRSLFIPSAKANFSTQNSHVDSK